MRGFLAVARREIVERRIVFAVSALAGLLPLAAVFLPAFKSHSPEDVRYAAACFFGVGLTGLLAITLGSTVISQELARGTLGFYFSKPLEAEAAEKLLLARGNLLAREISIPIDRANALQCEG